jgi:hypothetical protein
MHRLTARLLLLIVALGIFQPLLEAFSAEPPHACCLRRLHAHKDQQLQFHDATKPNGSCCPPLTTPHTANLIACRTTSYALEHSIVNFRFDDEAHHSGFASSLSTRAPPSPAFS